MGGNIFIYLKKPSIFVERIYQLKNFDMKVVILVVYFSRATTTTQFRTHTRKLVAS